MQQLDRLRSSRPSQMSFIQVLQWPLVTDILRLWTAPSGCEGLRYKTLPDCSFAVGDTFLPSKKDNLILAKVRPRAVLVLSDRSYTLFYYNLECDKLSDDGQELRFSIDRQ